MNILRENNYFDPEFGNDGFVFLPSAGGSDWGSTALSTEDGGMYVGYFSGQGFALAKLSSDGGLDARFGVDGIVHGAFPVAGSPFNIRCSLFEIIEVEEGERLLLVGEVYAATAKGPVTYPAIARYTSTGVLDTDFCEGGFRVFQQQINDTFAASADNDTNALQRAGLQSAGSGIAQRGGVVYALINGTLRHDENTSFQAGAVLAFGIDGEVDLAFGQAGIAIIKHPNFENSLVGLQVAEDGIYVTAWVFTQYSDYEDGAVAKLSLSGAIDSRFGVSGFADIGNGARPLTTFAGSQGNVIVVGDYRGIQGDPGFQRSLRAVDGQPDPDFNNGEPVYTEFDGATVYPRFGVVTGDHYLTVGRITLTGEQVIIQRYSSQGSPDESFGTRGSVLAAAAQMRDVAVGGRPILIDGSGRAVVVGFRNLTSGTGPVVARLLL